MARTIQEIQSEIFAGITANENLVELNSQSKVAVYRLIVFIVAFAIWTLEVLFDTHKSELQVELSNQKSGTLSWYRSMALAFQYGFTLLPDSDKFNNQEATSVQIEASKIVKYAAVNEGSKDSRIVIKIAGESAGILAPISVDQYTAFEAYINEVRYAGVKVTIVNYLPDKLSLKIKIYRDPLLIDALGNSIPNGGKPVEVAIKEYMKDLPFNGELVLAHLVDKLQRVEGVLIPHIISAESSWIDPTANGYGIAQPINVRTIPVSGYFEMVNFDSIEYVV